MRGDAAADASRSVLHVPGEDSLVHVARDREEEVAGFAWRVKAAVRRGALDRLDRAALVVRTPLPHVYVTREVLRSAACRTRCSTRSRSPPNRGRPPSTSSARSSAPASLVARQWRSWGHRISLRSRRRPPRARRRGGVRPRAGRARLSGSARRRGRSSTRGRSRDWPRRRVPAACSNSSRASWSRCDRWHRSPNTCDC